MFTTIAINARVLIEEEVSSELFIPWKVDKHLTPFLGMEVM